MNLAQLAAPEAERLDGPFLHTAAGPLSADVVARLHATFLVAFGAWPNLHMTSFEAVTGKKYDTWLVRAVGLLLVTTGSAIAVARRTGRVPASARVLGLGVSTSLAAVSLTYARKGRIPRIYFLDAALHAAFAAAWLASSRTLRSGR
jgi:hypothetical protein